MSFVSWFLSTGEKIGSRIVSKIFWPPCSASAVVFNDNGELLVVENGDYLMLPGGILERGESFSECAEREVREETGFEIKILERIDEWDKEFAGVEVIFTGEVAGGEISGSWEGNPKFLPVEEALERNWRWDRDIEEVLEKADGKP